MRLFVNLLTSATSIAQSWETKIGNSTHGKMKMGCEYHSSRKGTDTHLTPNNFRFIQIRTWTSRSY